MDPRQRWHTLQGRLTAARSALDAGDLATAQREVTAALELDRDFLAAQALRDRILKMSSAPATEARRQRRSAPRVRSAPPPAAAVPTPVHSAPEGGAVTAAMPSTPAPVDPAPVAAASVESVIAATTPKSAPGPSEIPSDYVTFEKRARRRRVDRRIDAVRDALDRKRIRAAAAALGEVIDLDPNQPELAELRARFDELQRKAVAHRRGPWVFAAAVFAAALFGASWIQDASPRILSRQMVWVAPHVAEVTPAPTIAERLADIIDPPIEPKPKPETATPALTSRLRAPDAPAPAPPAAVYAGPPVPFVRAAATVGTPPAADAPVMARATREAPAAAPIPPPAPAPVRTTAEAPVPTPVSTPAATAAAASNAVTADDGGLVRRALQRYRDAYEGLDARSAQEVWPAVNQPALARAFEGLLSQSLTFDACDVNLRGEAAEATCRGSARYVTKVGSRDPRVESRVWNFKLHKTGSDWQIDSARTAR